MNLFTVGSKSVAEDLALSPEPEGSASDADDVAEDLVSSQEPEGTCSASDADNEAEDLAPSPEPEGSASDADNVRDSLFVASGGSSSCSLPWSCIRSSIRSLVAPSGVTYEQFLIGQLTPGMLLVMPEEICVLESLKSNNKMNTFSYKYIAYRSYHINIKFSMSI